MKAQLAPLIVSIEVSFRQEGMNFFLIFLIFFVVIEISETIANLDDDTSF